jgi:hypothetical protein
MLSYGSECKNAQDFYEIFKTEQLSENRVNFRWLFAVLISDGKPALKTCLISSKF